MAPNVLVISADAEKLYGNPAPNRKALAQSQIAQILASLATGRTPSPNAPQCNNESLKYPLNACKGTLWNAYRLT